MLSGDLPLGAGKAQEPFRASVASANVLPLHSGQGSDGTGGSLVLPIPTSESGCVSSGGQSENLLLRGVCDIANLTGHAALAHDQDAVAHPEHLRQFR